MDKNIFYLARYPKSKLSHSEKLYLLKKNQNGLKIEIQQDITKSVVHL